MDATATPRGISLAVGELGARGRPINKQCTAVRISSTVNGDMCGTCQADLLSLSALARDARNPRLLFRAGGGPGRPCRGDRESAVCGMCVVICYGYGPAVRTLSARPKQGISDLAPSPN